MGSTSQTGREREREREMYLIVLLLISTALGRPNSAQLDVGENNVNQLNSIVRFTNETGSLLGDSRLIRAVSEGLQAAELNILEMEAELRTLQAQDYRLQKLQSVGSYVAAFNETKSYLQQARQELRDLADTAVKEVRDVIELLEDLDRNNDPDLLKIAIDIIKDLMLETKERLEAARERYQSVGQAFENLISTVTTQNEMINQTVVQLEAKYQEDKARAEKVKSDCQIASIFTFGLCSLIEHYVTEVPLENIREELADFKSKSDKFLERTRILNQDIDIAIDLIAKNLDQINTWADSAEDVSENIEDYHAEYLEKYESSREAFKTGLLDLKNVAEQFLVDRITTSSRLLGTDDEDLGFAEQNLLEMSMELNVASSSFAAVNEATSNLRQTRQELRELANRTVTEGRNLALLLDALPGSGTLEMLLRSFLDTWKDRMIKTEGKLERAREIYQSADEALRDLKGRLLILDEDRMLGRTTILIRDIDDARVVIDEEIEQIIKWNDNNDNIGQFPTEVLANNQADRDEFKTELVDLINIAENYLGHTE